jgi:hypothetical protein
MYLIGSQESGRMPLPPKNELGQQPAGVSILSWSAYLVSAILWFWFGMQKKDKNIYLPCVGWIVLDLGVIMGVIIYG